MKKLLPASSMIFVAMTASAQAADLYTPAPEPMPAYTGGWYISAFGGANWLENTGFDINIQGPDPITNRYDSGYVFGGAIGYDFGQTMGPIGVRLEGEVSYRNNDVDVHSAGGTDQAGSVGSTSALAGMANVLFDLETGGPFSFYGGGGVGVANVDFSGHRVNVPPDVLMNDDDTVFAWQAIAGVGYEVSSGILLDVQYRYFNASDVSLTSTAFAGSVTSSTDYESHAVLGGIRFKF